MIKFLRVINLSLLITISITAIAQEKIINKSNQQWVQYYAQINLNNKLNLLADAGYHAANNFKASAQYLIRTGLSYTFNSQIQAGIGFTHEGYYTSGKESRVEFRTYEEISMKTKLGNTEVTNRVRVEERFFKPVIDRRIKGQSTFNFRFRYLVMAGIPLLHLSKANNDAKLLLNVGDEVFFNAGKEIVYNVFDQNRILISPTVQFNKNFSVSFTYNSQFAATTTDAMYNRINVVWLQIRQKFNLSKNKEQKSKMQSQ